MKKPFSRIYLFPRGEQIDLRRVVCIGALDKNINAGTFFIPIYVTGMNEPIKITLGYAIGKVEETKKTEILKTIEEFQMAWYTYLALKEGGKNASNV